LAGRKRGREGVFLLITENVVRGKEKASTEGNFAGRRRARTIRREREKRKRQYAKPPKVKK